MIEYIIESAYNYLEPNGLDWEEDYGYDKLSEALKKYHELVCVTGKGLKWRIRKVTSETICES